VTWTNWAREQRCAPEAVLRPRSEEELCAEVARAAAQGRRMRAVGSGHSFTDCACTDGVMVDMRGLARVVGADSSSGLVTVEGGIVLRDLGPALAAHGLGLENQGDIDAQTLSGAICTATHGTGVRFPNLGARVEGVRLVVADGSVVSITDGDELRAAQVSLGALGVVSAVTVRAVPLYTLHRRDQPLPLPDVLERLDEHVDGADHFEFFVFPYTDVALTRTTRRSSEEPHPPPRWRRVLEEDLIENAAFGAACRTGRLVPRLAPALTRGITAAFSGGTLVDRGYRVYATERRVRFTEMEYAIPRAHAREAVERVIALVRRRRLPILFPLEVRFSAPDDAFLSTAHGRETAYVAVHQYAGMEFETFFRAVEAIMDEYGGRPHWGKRHYQTASSLRERYPEWDRFAAVRERLDPGRIFANDYTRRVLGA
jgi:L-gulonolactone oxidase